MAKIEQSIRLEHDRQKELYSFLQKNVIELVEEACGRNRWLFIKRLKEVESFALKVITGRTDGYIIDDFFACTIVVPNLKEVDDAKALAAASFQIVKERPGEYTTSWPSQFNFDGVRLSCKLLKSVTKTVCSELPFEIQIKTLLEHAWAEATHDFSYKSNDISWAKERLTAQIKAILNNVDLSIYDMDNISRSPCLDKRHRKYEKTNKILNFLKDKFGTEAGFQLPEDTKRLAEEVQRLLSRTGLCLDDLDNALQEESKVGRGYSTLNLSIYSIILLALFNQRKESVLTKLALKPNGKSPANIVIPTETRIAENHDISQLQYVKAL